uniref:Zinc finger, CCHC-type n=1 Tax=Tanacetum cinerariifolium TaxID=118510 RepID=A0A699U643_TANCI|nr:hypothetical protein [Tanacetum cinerariifolium]
MQGTLLTKQEREGKLYDEFDKFAYKKGEPLHDFHLRFSLLLNDMKNYNVKLEQFQVIHIVEIDIVKFVVEIESLGMSSDEFDKETGSSDGLQPKQTDLSCIHALYELHLHEICVVPSKHEANQY